MKFLKYGRGVIPVVVGLMILWLTVFLISRPVNESSNVTAPVVSDSETYFELMAATWELAWDSGTVLQNTELCSLVTSDPERFLTLSGVPTDLPEFVSLSDYQEKVLVFLNGQCSTLKD